MNRSENQGKVPGVRKSVESGYNREICIILSSLPHPLPLTGPISLSTDKPRFFKIMWVRLNAERAIVDMNTDIDRSR